MTFIVETSNCEDVNGLITEISQLLTAKGYSEGLSFISNDGKSGSIVFTCAVQHAVQQNEVPNETEITLASVNDQSAQDATINVPVDDTQQNQFVDIPAAEQPAVVIPPVNITKTGIVFIKSLLPSEPVPYKCSMEKDISELHVNSVAYRPDLVAFTYRNIMFKFPIEQDQSSADGTIIRVVMTLDNSETQQPIFLKVVEDQDDNHVVFGKHDTEKLGLIEQLSTQS